MEKVLRIVHQIQGTSGRNDKEGILLENSENILFKQVMQFIYDPFILTGLSKKKINKLLKLPSELSTLTIIDVMDYLKLHNSGRDTDIILVQNFIRSQPEILRDFLVKIVSKDLSMGLTDGTLNKVYGSDFKQTFSVMLAKKFEDHKQKIKGDFVVSEKLDGNRCVVVKDNGVVKSFTRQGKKYEGLEEIEQDIANLKEDNIVFDGELIADIQGSTIEIYAETTSKARSKGSNKKGLVYHIFDMLPLEDFQNGKSKTDCVFRKLMLTTVFENNTFLHCNEVKSLYIGSDLSEVEKWMIWAKEKEVEGLMVNMDKPYICKRSDSILKVKVMSTCDIRVIGFEEGTGKYEGKLGALIVDYKGFNCGVGSGFTDSDRSYIWNNKEEYLQRIIEVQYFEESKNAQGGISLRFPIFKKLRTDKSTPSYN
ncbi:MAG TPA: hypothetical protein VIM42_08450 [Clostridium sp.]